MPLECHDQHGPLPVASRAGSETSGAEGKDEGSGLQRRSQGDSPLEADYAETAGVESEKCCFVSGRDLETSFDH